MIQNDSISYILLAGDYESVNFDFLFKYKCENFTGGQRLNYIKLFYSIFIHFLFDILNLIFLFEVFIV